MMPGLLHQNVVPPFELPGSDGRRHRRQAWRGRRNLALFLLHDSRCGACRELLARLRADAGPLDEQETTIVPVLADTESAATELARALELPFALLADRKGGLRGRLLGAGEQVALLLTDRFGAVMERHAGTERDLPTGAALRASAQLVQFHCPECTMQLWNDD